MKHIAGVAEMKVARENGDEIVTHALGSCLGITAYDPTALVGGMLHVMLPTAEINPDKAKVNPFMFVDTGVPAFFRSMYEAGGVKGRLVVKVAGGANVHDNGSDRFAIGKRNLVMLKKLLWKNGVLIEAEDTGGSIPRTLHLEIGTGRVWIQSGGMEKDL